MTVPLNLFWYYGKKNEWTRLSQERGTSYVDQVKVKLSLHFTKCRTIKTHWEVEVQLHAFLTTAPDGGEWPASCPDGSTPGEGVTGTHWIGDWVGPTAIQDAVAKKKNSCTCRESNPSRPARSPVTVVNEIPRLQLCFVIEQNTSGAMNFADKVTTRGFLKVIKNIRYSTQKFLSFSRSTMIKDSDSMIRIYHGWREVFRKPSPYLYTRWVFTTYVT
jgi:hypothetical protein